MNDLSFEKQLSIVDSNSPYEWLVEYSEEESDSNIVGFDVGLTVGTRWGNHCYIDLGSAYVRSNENSSELVPEMYKTIAEIAEIVTALNNVKVALIDRITEIDESL